MKTGTRRMHYASRRTTFRSASFKTYFEGKFVQAHNASCARPDFRRITRRTIKCFPKLVKTDNASSSIKTANLSLSHSLAMRFTFEALL